MARASAPVRTSSSRPRASWYVACVSGSACPAMRLVALRMPFATTRTLPKWRVKRTRMRSASAKSFVLRTIASARYVRDATVESMVRNGARNEPRDAYDRSSVGRTLEAHIAAVDEEIRALLTGADPSLQPFYGMMLYHLGLDAERGPSGKRLRPVLCTLVYEALTGDARSALPAAAAIELLHNFTLIHDDIEDQDPARHHRPTVWSVWGVPQAINAGDGMFAVSRLAVQRLRCFPAERVLAFAKLIDEACVRVCEGQFLDISFETRTDVTAERYRAMAAKKTGALFAAAAQGAALLATDDAKVRETLARFGDAFGQAFQA